MATDEVKKYFEDEIIDYEKRIEEKSTIANYLLSKLIKLREEKANEHTIKYIEDEFHRLRVDIMRIEKLVNHFKDHIKICY